MKTSKWQSLFEQYEDLECDLASAMDISNGIVPGQPFQVLPVARGVRVQGRDHLGD